MTQLSCWRRFEKENNYIHPGSFNHSHSTLPRRKQQTKRFHRKSPFAIWRACLHSVLLPKWVSEACGTRDSQLNPSAPQLLQTQAGGNDCTPLEAIFFQAASFSLSYFVSIQRNGFLCDIFIHTYHTLFSSPLHCPAPSLSPHLASFLKPAPRTPSSGFIDRQAIVLSYCPITHSFKHLSFPS